jgi:hypothetical protein
MWWFEEIQTTICLRGYIDRLYSTRDVRTFCMVVIVRCGEPKQGDS